MPWDPKQCITEHQMHPTAPGPGTPTSGAIETPTPGETAQQRQTRRSRAIPRSPGSRAEETSEVWTGWRNLQVLEGGRRKPKGGLGFPLPLLLLLTIFPNRSLPLSLRSGQSHPPQRRAEAQPGSKQQTREIKRGWRSRGSLAGTDQPPAQPSQWSRCRSSCLRCSNKFASSLALSDYPHWGSRAEQHLSAWFVRLLAH